MNAQRPSNRFDSRMIRKPHRQPRFQRTAWGFVTLAFWGFYFYPVSYTHLRAHET